MASSHAIATVTRGLRLRLHKAVTDAGMTMNPDRIRAGRPDANDTADAPLITIFLYRVSPNAAMRNLDQPTYGADGMARHRPRIALDLHYLLSFSGIEQDEQHAQRLLGIVMAELNRAPGLTPMYRDDQDPPWYRPAEITNDIEKVRFSPVALALDDLSKLWSVFFQMPYRLSIAYEASVVLIESDVPTMSPLPVQRPGVESMAMRQPVISRVQAIPHRNADGSPTKTFDITIDGERLRGAATHVRCAPDELRDLLVERDNRLIVKDTRIVVQDEPLGVGVHRVEVVHDVLLGEPATPHEAISSGTALFEVRPSISARLEALYNTIVVRVSPDLRQGQQIQLLLNRFLNPGDPPPAAGQTMFVRIGPIQVVNDAPPNLGFALDEHLELRGASWLVRASVDGTESLIDSSGPTPSPLVMIP